MVNVTVFSFHPVFFPPKSGGEERVFYLYNHLSFFHTVTLISFTNRNESGSPEYIYHSQSFLEIRIPKSRLTDILYLFINMFSNIVECSAIISSIESIFNREFRCIGRNSILNSNVIIFEYPYSSTFFKKDLYNKIVIYDAHNNEYEMMETTLGHGIIGKVLLLYVHFIENRVINLSQRIFCVSESNIVSLSKEYSIKKKEFSIIPNGVSLQAYDEAYINRRPSSYSKIGIFTGSFHPPNITAISRIIEIAESTPDIFYLIIGNASDYFINQQGLTRSCQIDPSILCGFSRMLTIDGSYPKESWGNLSIIWTKPFFEIYCSNEISCIKISLYSESNQTIIIHYEIFYKEIHVNSGWNIIQFDVDGREHFEFHCTSSHSDKHRILGVAISEISYSKSGEWITLTGDKISSAIQCLKKQTNVILLGKVSEEDKLSIYQRANFAINPMTEGSGTNLKVLGYLAAGVPLITTHIGARGFPLINGTHAIICDLNVFPERIYHLISHPGLLDKLSFYGRKLVEDMYDWEKIAENFQIILQQ